MIHYLLLIGIIHYIHVYVRNMKLGRGIKMREGKKGEDERKGKNERERGKGGREGEREKKRNKRQNVRRNRLKSKATNHIWWCIINILHYNPLST